MSGKVCYVDEDEDDIVLFCEFAEGYFELETIKIESGDSLEDIVDEILSNPPDALITDYLLNEKARVGFNGQALIEEIQARNKHLPCFLLTSHAPDALNATHDARLVQSKRIPFGGLERDELKSLFRDQIHKVITSYRDAYRKAEEELNGLVALDPAGLNSAQRQRLLELDDYLDSFGLSSHSIPMEVKNDRNLALLVELISSVDEILKGRDK